MFTTILVPVDQSDAAKDAFELALRLARSEHAKLVLVNVLDLSKMIAVAGYESPYPIDAIAILKSDSEQLVDELKARAAAAGVEADALLLEGDACDEILRAASERHADLICMGTHGRKGLARLLVGSVAEGVLRRAEIPVLATRPIRERASDTPVHAGAPTTS
jgi:nucleotide-binding universal stress UspA family protein